MVALLSKAGYSDHLHARRLTPALRDGADLESSVTGAEAEAPAYYQAVPPRRSRLTGQRSAFKVSHYDRSAGKPGPFRESNIKPWARAFERNRNVYDSCKTGVPAPSTFPRFAVCVGFVFVHSNSNCRRIASGTKVHSTNNWRCRLRLHWLFGTMLRLKRFCLPNH